MPKLPNGVIGQYGLCLLRGNVIIANKAGRNLEMETSGAPLIMGTAKQAVLNIGSVSDEIDIQAPFLVGGASGIDGRVLMNQEIKSIVNQTANALPLLTSANISITESGANVGLKFTSDGNPNNQVLQISGAGANSLAGTPLDPLGPGGPTRLARHYDFRVNLAGITMYIMSASINITVQTEKKNFIPGVDGSSSGTDGIPGGGRNASPPYSNNPHNWNTQFPWIAVKGIQVSGSGEAAVELTTKNGSGIYTSATNASMSATDPYILTLQDPGCVDVASGNFMIQAYNCQAGTWNNLFHIAGDSTDIIDLTKSVINSHSFDINPGLLTARFNFTCWVH